MSLIDVVGPGCLPFEGSIRKNLPWMLHAATKVIGSTDRWDQWTFKDVTAGSCVNGAVFSAYGMSVIVNDLSSRSILAAEALYKRRPIPPSFVGTALQATANPEADGKSFDLANGMLLEEAVVIFDKLYFAGGWSVPEQYTRLFQYLAIRWVIEQKAGRYFSKPPTTDLQQLALQGAWAKVVNHVREPETHLLKLYLKIDTAAQAVSSVLSRSLPMILQGDCREAMERPYGTTHALSLINPPTHGNSKFLAANKVIDALISRQPYQSRAEDDPANIWRKLAVGCMEKAKPGELFFNFMGDGAVKYDEARSLVEQHGEILEEYKYAHNETEIAGMTLTRRK